MIKKAGMFGGFIWAVYWMIDNERINLDIPWEGIFLVGGSAVLVIFLVIVLLMVANRRANQDEQVRKIVETRSPLPQVVVMPSYVHPNQPQPARWVDLPPDKFELL